MYRHDWYRRTTIIIAALYIEAEGMPTYICRYVCIYIYRNAHINCEKVSDHNQSSHHIPTTRPSTPEKLCDFFFSKINIVPWEDMTLMDMHAEAWLPESSMWNEIRTCGHSSSLQLRVQGLLLASCKELFQPEGAEEKLWSSVPSKTYIFIHVLN